MIPRYRTEHMDAVWSDERKLEVWREIEALAAEALARLGEVPEGVAEAIRAAGPLDPEAVRAREAVTGHDKAAFVDLLAERMDEGGEWVHYGLTSSDVEDTATAVLLSEAAEVLLSHLENLFEVTRNLALEHRATPMIGRTHGVWAEPTTFGLKVAGWAFELARDQRRLLDARRAVAVGKVSGAVGTYAHVPPEVERHICERLKLELEPASTQVVGRDRHAEFLQTLALTGATLERIATEVRLLQRPEVGEVAEPFRKGQKGSSAMPHKRNPVRSERLSGLARLLRGYAQAGLENVALWHERDISHSSVERVIIPDACHVLDFMLEEAIDILGHLEVRSDRMAANLESTRGQVFSQGVLLALVRAGMERDRAYRLVQEAAGRAADQSRDLEEVLADLDLPISRETLSSCFDTTHVLRHTDVVFERLEKATLG